MDITERMGSVLMSDMPDINDIIKEIIEMLINDDHGFVDDFYRSTLSNGYFDACQESRKAFERSASLRIMNRRRLTVQCLQMNGSDSDSDESAVVANASQEYTLTPAEADAVITLFTK